MKDKEGEPHMNSTANARTFTHEEAQAGEGPACTGTLIKAVLSLSQAVEALSRLNLFGELSLPDVGGGISFYDQVSRFECALILEALRITRGRQREASALLGLKPTTLNSMLKRHGIDPDSFNTVNTVGLPRDEHEPESLQRPNVVQGNHRPMRLAPAVSEDEAEPVGDEAEHEGAQERDEDA